MRGLGKHSLRLRLIVAWAVIIALTLSIATWGLIVTLERSIIRRTVAELELDLRRVAVNIEVHSDGAVELEKQLKDPQYLTPYSGRYWQVSLGGTPVLRSPSLWDTALAVDTRLKREDGMVNSRIVGPDNQQLYALSRVVSIGDKAPYTDLQVTTAIDYADVQKEMDKITSDLIKELVGVGLVFLAAAWLHVWIGLRPLEDLRKRVAAIRSGISTRLDGEFPDELVPLISETNALLESQERTLELARWRASDLAHGLKTPLAVIAAKSRQLRRASEAQLADDIDTQIEFMRRHVERQLALARQRDTNRFHTRGTDASDAIREMIKAFQSLPRDCALDWDVRMPARMVVAAERGDLDDILGNLIENAWKWSRSVLRVQAKVSGEIAAVTIEDDGPGIPSEQINRLMLRGERADTSTTGSGLGLAIVKDLVEVCGARLELSGSDLGGLKATVLFSQPKTQSA